MSAFAALAAAGSPPHGGLALALAGELHEVDAAAADAALRVIADGFAAARGAPPHEQLAHCGCALGDHVAARVRPSAVEDLLLDHVLATGAGDPVCWAIAGVEAGRRAGVPLGIVADADEHVLVAHRGLGSSLVLAPRAPARPLPSAERPAVGEVTWRRPHETARMLLDRLVVRAARAGRLAEAVAAADLRLELPLGEGVLAALRDERDRLAQRWN